jgi:hypothetical protein
MKVQLRIARMTRREESNNSKRKRTMGHRRVRAVSHMSHSKRRRNQSTISVAPLVVTRSSTPSDD